MKTQQLINKLIEKNLTIGSVESFTGGLFASTLVNCPGASKTFKGSIVAYSNEIKEKLVKVNKDDLDKHSAVSSEVALELARNGREVLGVDLCFAFTGDAGPIASRKAGEVGEVYIAVALENKTIIEHYKLKGDRLEVRTKAVEIALGMLERLLKKTQ